MIKYTIHKVKLISCKLKKLTTQTHDMFRPKGVQLQPTQNSIFSVFYLKFYARPVVIWSYQLMKQFLSVRLFIFISILSVYAVYKSLSEKIINNKAKGLKLQSYSKITKKNIKAYIFYFEV